MQLSPHSKEGKEGIRKNEESRREKKKKKKRYHTRIWEINAKVALY